MNVLLDFLASLFCAFLGTCEGKACETVEFRGVDHTVCRFDVKQVDVRLHLDDEKGNRFARVSRLPKQSAGGKALLMAMNGGMYHDDLGPVGLYVEKGVEKKRLSTKGGYGNFHLLPNGVFWGSKGKVFVTETKAFARMKAKGKGIDFATQSGPMLLINGKRHPRFLKNSDSRKIRNGVGVSRDRTQLHFAISHGTVTFWDFADLFSQKLGSHNALFLDGTVSAIRADGISRSSWRSIGPIIGIYEKKP